MPQSNISDSPEMSANDNSFGDILTQFEQTHRSRGETVEGTVMTVTADTVFVDIGRKMDGAAAPRSRGESEARHQAAGLHSRPR